MHNEPLTAAVKQAAREAGFDLVGIAPAMTPPGYERLTEWIEQGFAGEMGYIARRAHAYEHPRHVMPDVRSIVMLGINYNTLDDRKPQEPHPSGRASARVARYAHGTADYHDALREKLKQLADRVHQLRPGSRTRGVVDTAPLLERDFARLAGLGWFGKNTMLINRKAGSWLLLAALLTDLELEPDRPHETSHCGTCTRCLDVCPTDAFVGPHVLDARRCISYLTIELRSPIPTELRDGVGDWLFGCDLCQQVCPWNRKSPLTSDPIFQPLPDLQPASALDILKLSEAEFQTRFQTTPLSRPGWDGLRRNAAIVLGNSGDASLIPELTDCLNEASALVQEAIQWALEKLQKTSCSSATED
ncbi:tRNA epoxyqueuosine(34) reductase QueG [Schlesneria sp.]|uniref:tRNA epoxyqueuosine(34) reductase QueG n=1 Tax=Schlesneria sp. TaxID=2762018 RepID=UPI002EE4405D